MQRGEESRIGADSSINNLVNRLGTLTDQMKAEQNLMAKLAESQIELKPIFSRLEEGLNRQGFGGPDTGVQMHIRNIDTHLARLLEDGSQGRKELIQEIRTEIRVLSRTLAAIAEQAGR